MATGSLLDYIKKERNNLEVKGDEPDKVCILRIPKLVLQEPNQVCFEILSLGSYRG